MRALSSQIVSAMMAQQTSEVLALCAEINHDSLGTPLRVTSNTEDISVNGDVFTACGFDLILPPDTESGQQEAKLRFDNVDQWLTPTVRTYAGGFTVTLSMAVASNLAASPPEFDNVEIEFEPMPIRDVKWDAFTMEATLAFDNLASAKYPPDKQTPFNSPGLF